jgi:hypothetical protein
MSGKKFIVNGIPMITGHSFNWEEDMSTGRALLKIAVGSVYNMRTCLYDPSDHTLIITVLSNQTQITFHAQAIGDAESIVIALHKGMKCDILPLYQKR